MDESYKTEMLDVASLTGDTMDVTFTVLVPGGSERRYPMRAVTMRLGRSDQADITVKEPSVSSRHLDFIKADGRLYVRDLGSSNGTFLNEQRIEETELQHGDVLRVGSIVSVTVEIAGAGSHAAAPPPAQEAVEGSTVMLSAADLQAHRAAAQASLHPASVPTPQPRRAPSYPPQQPAAHMAPTPHPGRHPIPQMASHPMYGSVPPSRSGGGKTALIGALVAVLVLVAGGAAFFLISQSRQKAADREILAQVERETTALTQINPCASVQESVATLIKLEQAAGVPTPTLPARTARRSTYDRFVDLQRDKARQYKRIVNNLEQNAAASQVSVDRLRGDLGRLNDRTLKALAVGVQEALDDRSRVTEDFINGWKRLQRETETYAELVEEAFVKGNSGAARDFEEHRFHRQAPQILGACNSAQRQASENLREKVAAFVAAAP